MASNGIMFISNFMKTDTLSFEMKQTDGKRGRWKDMTSLNLFIYILCKDLIQSGCWKMNSVQLHMVSITVVYHGYWL
jgi:hypothetical protein